MTIAVHPRLTVFLPRGFEVSNPLEDDLRRLSDGGADRVGLLAQRLLTDNDGAATIARSGPELTHVAMGALISLDNPKHEPGTFRQTHAALDAALAAGASIAYGVAGGAPALEWDDAAAAFVSGISPVAELARELGITLLIEPTNPLFADMSFLTTLHDTAELAERAGIGVCLDVQHCWTERGLRAAIRGCAPITGLVQISDWVPGNRHHHRAVPGDGAIPLERIVGWILETGYSGLFDLEVYAEPNERDADAVARAIERGNALLECVGAY